MSLTRLEKRLIRDSMPSIYELAAPIGLLFYGRLFDLNPALRPMFRGDLELQSRKLMEMLNTMVNNLDHFMVIIPTLKALGQRHAGYGVHPEHYDQVTAALLWAFGSALDAECDAEVKAAWRAALSAVAAVMKEGAAELSPLPDPTVEPR